MEVFYKSENRLQVNGDNARGGAASVGRYKYDRERKLGHRRIGEGGQITYKKIETTQLMGSIQLGIQHTVCIIRQSLDAVQGCEMIVMIDCLCTGWKFGIETET